MHLVFKLYILILFATPIFSVAQNAGNKVIFWADSVLEETKFNGALSTDKAVTLFDSIASIYSSVDRPCDTYDVLVRRAGIMGDAGNSEEALSTLLELEAVFDPSCDSNSYILALSNLSYVYLQLEELDVLDSICPRALKLCGRKADYAVKKLTVLNNWAISYAYRGNLEQADSLFRVIYEVGTEIQSEKDQSKALVNLGTLKGMSGDLDSAYYFFQQAGILLKVTNRFNDYVPVLINLSQVEMFRENIDEAHAILDSAERVSERIGNKEYVSMVQRARSEIFESSGDYESAISELKDFIVSKEDFLNEERIRVVGEMQTKYETEKKKNRIQFLSKQNRIKARQRNTLIAGFLVLLILTLLIFFQRNRVIHERKRSDALLLNILPASIAEELKEKGEAEAQLIDEVTVLFTDFKGFTQLSAQLSAPELVKEINERFSEFDRIMQKHNIEKIKTIGDAYMAAGGLPSPRDGHARDVINAALEIQEFMFKLAAQKKAQGKPFFEMRVGVHTGPVVAGIVGIKKFQYDIWGDTVNTASRMESSGEVGRVNISGETYELVKNEKDFSFESRGKVAAKGKGKMEMLFVTKNER